MTSEDFLKDPYHALSSGALVPDEWIRQAWKHSRLRDDVLYELSRSVSKVGSFNLAGTLWFDVLPRILDSSEVVELYLQIRDESGRLEFEWRPAFAEAFGALALELPRPQDEEIITSGLFEMIDSGHAVGFEGVLFAAAGLPNARELLTTARARAEQHGRSVLVSLISDALNRI